MADFQKRSEVTIETMVSYLYIHIYYGTRVVGKKIDV